MARVSFHVPDSGEKSFGLTPERVATIGRDPGNDIVLRDPKVSRHHARISFERGFFVIHDLSSSNGTYVNGKKVRTAPLTDRAELRMGSCLGKFTEEAADSAGESGTRPQNKIPATLDPGGAHPPGSTSPHPKTDDAEGNGVSKAAIAEPLPVTPNTAKTSTDFSPTETGDRRLRGVRYLIDMRNPEHEIGAIHDEQEAPLFFFRNPVTLVGFVARLVAAMITVSGAATAAFLFWQDQIIPAIAAVSLTVSFIFVVLMLVPRQQILLYSDATLSSIAMMLIQETRFSFPSLRFTLRKADGSVIGGFQKNLSTNFGRRRWWIMERPALSRVGFAKEESLARAALRLIVATVKTNFLIHIHGRHVGSIERREPVMNRYRLNLHGDAAHFFDRRLAIGLAVLIESVEGR